VSLAVVGSLVVSVAVNDVVVVVLSVLVAGNEDPVSVNGDESITASEVEPTVLIVAVSTGSASPKVSSPQPEQSIVTMT